jgi:hypothetical protein
MDGGVESGFIGESQVGEMMRFEVAPDTFDVVELGYWAKAVMRLIYLRAPSQALSAVRD